MTSTEDFFAQQYGAKKGSGSSSGMEGHFLANVFKNLGEIAVGIPLGLLYTAGSLGHDALRVGTAGAFGDQFKTDDLARGIKDYYVKDSMWSPLVQGDFNEAFTRFHNKPVDPIFDIFGAVTGGAGAVVKGGTLAGKAGLLDDAGKARVASLRGYTPYVPGEGPESPSKPIGDSTGTIESLDPEIEAALADIHAGNKDLFGDGTLYSPTELSREISAQGVTGTSTKKLSENPATRKIQNLLEDNLIPRIPLGYEQKRLVNMIRGDQRREGDTNIYKTNRLLMDARAGMDDDTSRALWHIVGSVWDARAKAAGDRGTAVDQYIAAQRHKLEGKDIPLAEQRIMKMRKELSSVATESPYVADIANISPGQTSLLDNAISDKVAQAVARATPEDSDVHKKYMDIIEAEKELEIRKELAKDPESLASLQKQIDFFEANRDKIYEALNDPYTDSLTDIIKNVSRQSEARYVESNPNVTQEDIAKNRGREYRLLVGENADDVRPEDLIFRSHYHKNDDRFKKATKFDQVLNNNYIKRGMVPRESLKSTGKAYMAGQLNDDLSSYAHTFASYERARIRGDLFNKMRGGLVTRERRPDGYDESLVGDLKSHKPFISLIREPQVLSTFRDEVSRSRGELDTIANLVHNDRSITNPAVKQEILTKIEGLKQAYPEMDELDNAIAIPRDLFLAFMEEQGQIAATRGWIMSNVMQATDIWRNMVLNYRPQWIVNNALGGLLLHLASYGPTDTLKHLIALYSSKGLSKELRKHSGAVLGSGSSEMYRYGDGAGLFSQEMKERKLGKALDIFERVGQKMGDINVKYADDPFRMMAVMSETSKDLKTLMAMYEKRGIKITPEEAAQRLMSNDEYVDGVMSRVLKNMVDFKDLSPFEKKYLRSFLPFYSWMKGITKTSGHQLMERPGSSYAFAGPIGSAASEQNEESLGEVPSYMRGNVPLPGFLQNEAGTRTMATGALNPWATPTQLASMLAQYTPSLGISALETTPSYGGESLGSQVNPILRAVLEGVSTRDMFYGSQLPGSRGDIVGVKPFKDLPLPRLALDIIQDMNGTAHKGSYVPNAKWDILSYMTGIPVKEINPTVARQRNRELERERNK